MAIDKLQKLKAERQGQHHRPEVIQKNENAKCNFAIAIAKCNCKMQLNDISQDYEIIWNEVIREN